MYDSLIKSPLLLFVDVIKRSPTMLWIAIAALMTTTSAEFLRDCHTTDAKPYIYYATKTPYELINNEDSSPIFVAGTTNFASGNDLGSIMVLVCLTIEKVASRLCFGWWLDTGRSIRQVATSFE